MFDELDADVRLWSKYLPSAVADPLFEALMTSVQWERHTVRMFGREIPCPRLSAWYGDVDATYRYAGVSHRPHAWTPELLGLREQLSAALSIRFNAVLLNLYRDGSDSMGWHADDEPELGPEPAIASISLGAERRFLFRHRVQKDRKIEMALGHGSLLVMRGGTQRNWQHSLPRSRRVRDARINLTFRRILPRP